MNMYYLLSQAIRSVRQRKIMQLLVNIWKEICIDKRSDSKPSDHGLNFHAL